MCHNSREREMGKEDKGETEGGRDGRTDGGMEGEREGGMEGGRDGWREGRREGGEGRREGGPEGGSMEEVLNNSCIMCSSSYTTYLVILTS